MKQLSILVLFLIGIYLQAQSFEQQTKEIADRIDAITLTEKNELKLKIKNVDKQLEEGEITFEEAKVEKTRLANYYAERIEKGVNAEKEKLDTLIAARVDGKVYSEKECVKKSGITIENINIINKNGERRTTNQLVFAFGLNTLQGDKNGLSDDLKLWQSKFWELGYTWNTRLSKESNLFHIKYGVSLLFNNYSPKNNKVFTVDGDKTFLADSDINFKRNRFRNLHLNVPIHFEFDLSPMKFNKNGEKLFRSHNGLRIGIGGYAGLLINSRNSFKYKKDGSKIKYKEKKDFNVNDFNYGLSAYIGYGQISLYTKYDLQPVFKNNPVDENNLSIGLRWDFH